MNKYTICDLENIDTKILHWLYNGHGIYHKIFWGFVFPCLTCISLIFYNGSVGGFLMESSFLKKIKYVFNLNKWYRG